VHKSGYILEFTWTSPKLNVVPATVVNGVTTVPQIVVPIDKAITVSPEWLDVGKKQIVILSPSQCSATSGVSVITNASAQFFNLSTKKWVCRDLTTL